MNVCPECGQTFQQGGFCTQDGTALLSSSGDPLLGAMLGPYRVAHVVGVGGMGRVYKGINPTIRSRVAIKVLSHDCADQPELVERFFAEARAVNLIRHENIVNILDLARLADGRPYIVMEFLDGSPLAGLLSQLGRLPLGTLARWTLEVLAGLGAAHAKSVVHRDLKPDNIFISRHGRAKILDFGVAKLASENRDGTSRTRAGSLLGTPHYMSPEQAQSLPTDARADIYAVGVILYEAATGQRPVDGESVFEILRKQVEEEPPPPRRFVPDMPPAYERVIVRAMAKDPARRWQSADELARALSEASAVLPPAAWATVGAPSRSDLVVPPTGARTPDHRWQARSRGPRVALLVIAALVLAGAATAAIVAGQRRSGQDQQAQNQEQPAAGQPGAAQGGGDPSASLDAAAAPASSAARPPADAAAETNAVDPANDVGAADAGSSPARVASVGAQEEAARRQEQGGGAGGPRAGRRRERKGRGGEKQDPNSSSSDAAGAGEPDAENGPDQTADETADQTAGETTASRSRGALRQESAIRGASSWDVSGYLPKALARARGAFPDAVLVRIDAEGVYPSGKADLTLDDGFSVLYRFMSPSRAKRPDDLPKGVEHKPTCMYYVSIDRKSVTAYPVQGWSCEKERPIPMPRCSAKQIWKRAAGDGAPTKNAVGSLSYRFNLSGDVTWWFSIGKDHQHTYEDDC